MLNSKKSSFSSSKSSKYNGKLKDVLLSSSPKTAEPKLADIKDFSNVPIIRQCDNARVLPKYTAILSKNVEEGVAKDDLDNLQQALEKLLIVNTVRTRFFLGEYSQADQKDDGKSNEKAILKRKRPDEKTKYKDVKNGLKVAKIAKSHGDGPFKEIPKFTLPRNDNSDKFWASIEPYCAPVNKDDVAFLDSLIQEFSKEIDKKIPDIGEHYAAAWSDELLNDEQNLGKSPSKKADHKKNGLHAMVESFGGPLSNAVFASLIRDRVVKSANAITKNAENGSKINKMKAEMSKFKHNFGQKTGACFEKRLLKELVDQGILTQDDVSKNVPDDEILMEIKKCQQELLTVNKYNYEELTKLRSAVLNDIHCNQLKGELDKIDKEVWDLYNTVVTRLQDEGKDYDKVLSEKMLNEFQSKANSLLRQQNVQNREINSMTDMSMLY